MPTCTEDHEFETSLKDLKQLERINFWLRKVFFVAKKQNSFGIVVKPTCCMCMIVDARGASVLCAGEDHV